MKIVRSALLMVAFIYLDGGSAKAELFQTNGLGPPRYSFGQLTTIGPTVQRGDTVVPGLQLTLSSDKSVYSVGEDPLISEVFANRSSQASTVPALATCEIWVTGPDGGWMKPNLSRGGLDTYSPRRVQLVEPGASPPRETLRLSALGYAFQQPGAYALRLDCNARVGGKLDPTGFGYSGGIAARILSNSINLVFR